MLKNVLSILVVANIFLVAVPANAACTTDQQKTENKQLYTDQENQACCCRRQGTTTKFICDVVGKADCATNEDTIKLSGPNYCPCEFTRAES